MTDTQIFVIVIVSVVACTCIFFAGYDIRASNGRTARAFSSLLFALGLGIAFVTVAEMSKVNPTLAFCLIVAGRVVKVAGVFYFVRFLRRKPDGHKTELPQP